MISGVGRHHFVTSSALLENEEKRMEVGFAPDTAGHRFDIDRFDPRFEQEDIEGALLEDFDRLMSKRPPISTKAARAVDVQELQESLEETHLPAIYREINRGRRKPEPFLDLLRLREVEYSLNHLLELTPNRRAENVHLEEQLCVVNDALKEMPFFEQEQLIIKKIEFISRLKREGFVQEITQIFNDYVCFPRL